MRALWNRIVDCAVLPGDDAEIKLKKRLQVAMALASIPAIFTWGLCFFVLDHVDAAWMAWSYCVATVVMLVVLATTKRWAFFRAPHTFLVLIGPAALHLYLGGFASSGGALLWSLIAPVAAMMFSSRTAPWWFAVFIVIAIAGFFVETSSTSTIAGTHALTSAQVSFFFAYDAVGLAGFLYMSTRWFVVQLESERARSERLLLNVLPKSIAERLKKDASSIADRFESVTVLFSDIVGFTPLSAKLSANELVDLLNEIFSAFDELADKHGLEKIKTIGDAYMVVGGLPEPVADHAHRVAAMALSMRDAIDGLAKTRGFDVRMRIGIHSGDVVAGVIGRKKFSYDLWGDTVNTASRMESHGAPGRVHISASTRSLLGSSFAIEERGVVEVKGKGAMTTFWLNSLA